MRKLELGSGIFDMDFISSVSNTVDLDDAVKTALTRVDDSSALPKNKAKAKIMISRCSSVDQLVMGMSNFMLSHAGMGVL